MRKRPFHRQKRPPLYRLRNGNSSNQGTFGYRLLDFAGSARQQRTSQRTCHHRRRCHRDRVCFILYQHGSKSKGDRDDAGNTRRDGQRGFRHAPERIRQERGGISSEHKSDRSQPERGHCRKRRQDECDPRRQNPGQRRPPGNYQKFRSGKPFHRDGPPGRPSERIYADLPSARLCSRRYHRILATGPHGLSGR